MDGGKRQVVSLHRRRGKKKKLKEEMATEVDDVPVQLEAGMKLLNIEQGIKLIATVLVDHQLNKCGIRNILKSAWKEFEDLQINWVQDNFFVIVVRDENVATPILDLVPWAMMKQNLSVKR